MQCCQGTPKLPKIPSPGGSREEEGREEARQQQGRTVPADPSADLLLGHCKENIYISVGVKLTYKCQFLDIIWESDK